MEKYLKKTVETYNRILPNYIENTSQLQPRQEFDAFCSAVVPQGVVLDVGCAWGRDCQSFTKHDFTVIGLDLSKEMLEFAKNFAPTCTFYEADLRKIPLNDTSVDGIWCCASLLHLKRSQVSRALKEFRRVLKTGAVCCVLVKKGVGERVDNKYSANNPRFFTYFHEDEIRTRLLATHFSILDARVTNEKDTGRPGSHDQEWIYFLARKT